MLTRCEDPVHRFPMKTRQCYCGKLNVGAPRWGRFDPKRHMSTAATTLMGEGLPGSLIEDYPELNKFEKHWATAKDNL